MLLTRAFLQGNCKKDSGLKDIVDILMGKNYFIYYVIKMYNFFFILIIKLYFLIIFKRNNRKCNKNIKH